MENFKSSFILLIVLCSFNGALAQLDSGVYFSDKDGVRNELKINDDYLILSVYKTSPAEFMQTMGGFYIIDDGKIKVDLEFNSNYAKDSILSTAIPYEIKDEKIHFLINPKLSFTKMASDMQDLDGEWLFATRGPDKGQDRRGEASARKTLKFLMNGRFQWIAYHTESMKFSGTGGGSFTSKDGKYVESIEFFSRDNSRVGAELGFDYEVKGEDWHHTGLNSKGEPMYEIWAKRPHQKKK